MVVDSVLVGAGAAALVAGVATNLAVPLASGVARAVRAVDYPGGRKQHRGAVPRLGGLAIAAGLLFGAGGVALVGWGRWGARVDRRELAALLLGVALVFLVGLVDDLVGVSAGKRFVLEFIAGSFVVGAGWRFEVLVLPWIGEVHLGALGVAVSLVWIVGVTNAINLLDGLDGLAAGVVAIIAGSVLVHALMQQNVFTVILMAAITGGCLGFLRYNWEPARIFMGDAGSLSLGFLIGAMTVHSSLKSATAVAILVPILALGVPVIDTLLVMVARFMEASEKGLTARLLRMFRADRRHLHHVLESAARHRGQVVIWIYGMVMVFCAGALWVAATKSTGAGLVLVVVEIGAVFVVRSVGLSRRARALSREKRREARSELFASEGDPQD